MSINRLRRIKLRLMSLLVFLAILGGCTRNIN